MIVFDNLLPSDQVSALISILHQRHCSDELARPVGVVVFEAADGEDEVWRHVHHLAHPVDVRLRGVLVGWCPTFDDGTSDFILAILLVVHLFADYLRICRMNQKIS